MRDEQREYFADLKEAVETATDCESKAAALAPWTEAHRARLLEISAVYRRLPNAQGVHFLQELSMSVFGIYDFETCKGNAAYEAARDRLMDMRKLLWR